MSNRIKIIKDCFDNPQTSSMIGLETEIIKKAKTPSGQTCYYVRYIDYPIFEDEFIFIQHLKILKTLLKQHAQNNNPSN